MIKCFRVIDLQELLGYAGRNKNGRKSDLVDRAMQMIKTTGSNKKVCKNLPIFHLCVVQFMKIKDIADHTGQLVER